MRRRTLPARQINRKETGLYLENPDNPDNSMETKNLACSSDHQKGNGFTLKIRRICMTLDEEPCLLVQSPEKETGLPWKPWESAW
jgi:hypothetical protein